MPAPELVCEVRTERGTYRNWTTVSVAQAIDGGWQRTFELRCAEPSEAMVQALSPGTRVDIALAGQPVITQGYIARRQSAYDGNRHGVQVTGFSKANLTTRASAEGGTGQYRGYTLEQIANGELKRLGLKFRLENPPDGANEPFRQVMRRYGETPYDLISRLCRQRGVWMFAEADGTIVAGSKDGASKGGAGGGSRGNPDVPTFDDVFQEGVNILSANCDMEWREAATYVATGQHPGSDNLFGRKAAEPSAKITLQDGGVPGLSRRVLAEMPLSEKELQLRTAMEAQAIIAASLRVSLSYQGWLSPTGKLWSLTDNATVKSPMLFPFQGGQMNLRLWSYNYTQTPEGQTVTMIELVNQMAFNLKFTDGQAPATFDPSFTSPSPEASV